MRSIVFSLISIFIIFFIAACLPAGPDINATATQDVLNTQATQTVAAVVTATIPAETATLTSESPTSPATEQASPTATQPSQAQLQFIAYIQNGQLLVTDVTNGVKGGTTQYTVAGESDQVS